MDDRLLVVVHSSGGGGEGNYTLHREIDPELGLRSVPPRSAAALSVGANPQLVECCEFEL